MKLKLTIFIGLAVVVFGVAGYFIFINQKAKAPIAQITTPGNLKTYTNQQFGFSVKYPLDFTLNEQYVYTAMGPGKDVPGVSFVIPVSIADGTNLAHDSYISIEAVNKPSCTDADFFDNIQTRKTITENGIAYDVISGSGAGAGNFYEEIIYLLPHCQAIRYFIHSFNIYNYDPGTVQEFDHEALIKMFDSIRQTYQYQK